MLNNYFSYIFSFFFFGQLAIGQEIQRFTVSDFDLKGKVKLCTVITDYGKEVFEFDETGRLIKSTTQYNESDQDIAIYVYANGELTEKRMESYKDGVLDEASSMVNFYKLDTLGVKSIKERIISYDKQFHEEQEYRFDEEDRIDRIIVSHENAVDEVKIEYTAYKGEKTKTYFTNEIIEKSVRESERKTSSQGVGKVILTKEYVDGEPNKAIEEVYGTDGVLISTELFAYDVDAKEFATQTKRTFEYDENGNLAKERIKKGNAESLKEYIFQLDASDDKNWVKKIVTPDNSYTTRKIEYYPKEIGGPEEPN